MSLRRGKHSSGAEGSAFPAGPQRRRHKGWAAVSLAILVFGIGGSAIGARATQSDAQSTASRAFISTSNDIAKTIGAELQRDIDFTFSQGAILAVSPDLDNLQFKRLFDSIGVDQRYPGGVGFVFFERVAASQLAAFETTLVADPVTGLPIVGQFSLIPPGDRQEYCLQRLGV